MILPDVNVLIYCFRQDMPEHAISRRWLLDIVSNNTRFGVSTLALSALVRIVTNPRIFRTPDTTPEALAFCDYLLSLPFCETVSPGDQHWTIFKRLCAETATRGPGIQDAWFAALAIEWGCAWITFDRDYDRFPGLNWRVPKPP